MDVSAGVWPGDSYKDISLHFLLLIRSQTIKKAVHIGQPGVFFPKFNQRDFPG
jgi:hypothetical protein